MPVTPPPSVTPISGELPDRGQTEVQFDTNQQNFVNYQANFGPEVNDTTDWINTVADQVEVWANETEADAGISSLAASAAAASAASALASPGTTATSTTSLTITTGTQTLTIQTGKTIVTGMFMTCAYDSTNYMYGSVVSYSGSTLVLNITDTMGSGTYAVWSVALSAPPATAARRSNFVAASTNILQYSTDFSNAAWSKTDVTLTGGFADNFGGLNAFEANETTTTGAGSITQTRGVVLTFGQTAVFSCYVKRGTATGFTLRHQLTGGTNTGKIIQCTWLTNTSISMIAGISGITNDGLVDYGYTVENNAWIRVFVVVQANGTPINASFHIRPTLVTVTLTGTTFFSHAQVTTGKYAPSLYTETTSAAASSGGVIKQNLCLYSETITNAAWGKTNCTAIDSQIKFANIALASITRTATGNHNVSQLITATPAGKTYTASVVICSGTYIGGVTLRLRDGTNTESSTLNITPTFLPTRYSITRTFSSGAAANVAFSIDPSDDVGVAGDIFYVGGAQVVEGFQQLDYTPTTSAAVNCSAFVMESLKDYTLDSTAAALVVAMPPPSVGAEVSFVDAGGNASTNNITIKPNGALIMGLNESFVINQSNRPFYFKYTRQRGWILR
jgi:hypothetical protein